MLEELAGEEDDDMLEIFWNEIHANAVRKAFDRLTSDEKEYLQRNAVPFVSISQQGTLAPIGNPEPKELPSLWNPSSF